MAPPLYMGNSPVSVYGVSTKGDYGGFSRVQTRAMGGFRGSIPRTFHASVVVKCTSVVVAKLLEEMVRLRHSYDERDGA